MSESVTYEDFVRKLFNWSGDPSKDFAHALLGVYTEMYEYATATDAVNALEEAGDIEFYAVAMAMCLSPLTGLTPTQMLDAPLDPNLFQADPAEQMNQLFDASKRWIGYGKVPPNPLALFDIVLCMQSGLAEFGEFADGDNFSRDRRRSSNMAKLLKRYPGGDFDAFRALNRDLAEERRVLETQ